MVLAVGMCLKCREFASIDTLNWEIGHCWLFLIVGLQLYLEKTHAISGVATGMNIYIVLTLKSQQGGIET